MENYEKMGYLQEPFRLFSLKDTPKKELSLHYHDFYKIIVFYGGSVTYMIEGKSYVLEPGDIVLVSRSHIHRPTIDPDVPYERRILYISEECLEGCRCEGYDPFFCFRQAAQKQSYVLRLRGFEGSKAAASIAAMETEAGGYGWQKERALHFQFFLLELNRICAEEGRETAGYPKAIFNQKVIDILAYLNAHLFEEVSIDDLAGAFYISKYHMMRLFKAETGYTIHRYLTEKRIAAAKEKLQKGAPAVKAGEECGFQDYSTFLRAFESCVHMTPTAFAESRKGRSLREGHSPL